VIGRDVLYDTVAARGVTRLLTSVLKPEAKALIADLWRSVRTGTETFVRLMTTAGFQLTSRWIRGSVNTRDSRAKVYLVTPSALPRLQE
jgi:hypothetical protein